MSVLVKVTKNFRVKILWGAMQK